MPVKLTESYLRKIIREEVSRLFNEEVGQTFDEAFRAKYGMSIMGGQQMLKKGTLPPNARTPAVMYFLKNENGSEIETVRGIYQKKPSMRIEKIIEDVYELHSRPSPESFKK